MFFWKSNVGDVTNATLNATIAQLHESRSTRNLDLRIRNWVGEYLQPDFWSLVYRCRWSHRDRQPHLQSSSPPEIFTGHSIHIPHFPPCRRRFYLRCPILGRRSRIHSLPALAVSSARSP